jgi:hypothetical protein
MHRDAIRDFETRSRNSSIICSPFSHPRFRTSLHSLRVFFPFLSVSFRFFPFLSVSFRSITTPIHAFRHLRMPLHNPYPYARPGFSFVLVAISRCLHSLLRPFALYIQPFLIDLHIFVYSKIFLFSIRPIFSCNFFSYMLCDFTRNTAVPVILNITVFNIKISQFSRAIFNHFMFRM